MLARIVVMVTCSWLVASAAAGQTSPPATVPVTRNVVGLSYVSLGDFEVRTRQVRTDVVTPDGQVSQWSNGAYAPRIAQAPLDPFFTEVGLEQDAPDGAL